MLTPAQLERATPAFRRGYNDAINDRPRNPQAAPGTFALCDYVEGYLVGRQAVRS